MKVKILKKSIKEGDNYCIKSLYCSVSTADEANELVKLAREAGATNDLVPNLIKKSEYEGEVSYCFGLNCSSFTFDRVQRFGILDCSIIYEQSKKGYISAKIQIVDRKEQILGYTEPEPMEEEVQGWATAAPEPVPSQPLGDASHAEPFPVESNSLDPNAVDDLPF